LASTSLYVGGVRLFAVAFVALFALAAAAVPEVPAASAVAATDAEAGATLVAIDVVNRVYFREETFVSFLPIKVGEAVTDDDVAAAAIAAQDEYLARGYLTAHVTAKLVPALGGVRARFVVEAGERAELKAVHIVGNDHVAEADLKEGLFSRPPEPLGALTRAGLYHRPYVDQDQQRVVYNYYKRGYLEARVVETRVTAASDLSGLQLTMQVLEGPQYELASLTFEGDLPEGETSSAWRARVPMADGAVADLVTLQQQTDPLLDAWREQGYPFARFEQLVNGALPPSKKPEQRGIGLVLKVVKGPLATVREVHIVGNKGTAEHVFRRELEVTVNGHYDHKSVKQSEKNLMQTGLLQSAAGRAVPVGGPLQADGTALVDVEFAVVETQTWMLSPAFLGDANEGLILIGVAGDRNLLGTGLQAYTSVQWSALRFLFDASLTEPRLFSTRSSATIEAHRRELRYTDFIVASVFGGSVKANYGRDLGFRLGGPARWFVGGGAGVEYSGVRSYDDKPLQASSLLPAQTFRNTLELRGGLDTREGGLSPRNGVFVSGEAITAGPWTASGLTFVDVHANVRGFWSPLFDITLKSNTQLGGVFNPLGQFAPVTDRYFLGGIGSVRGFFPRSIGASQKVALTDGSSITADVGGVVKVVQNFELEVPVWPGIPVRAFGFADFGNAFGDDELDDIVGGRIDRNTDFLVANLMMSTGFGLLLDTPVLPFRLEWSIPITKRSFDQPVNFFLGVGSAF
jgi:outer membrane protein insertion porin family